MLAALLLCALQSAGGHAKGFATITEAECRAHVFTLADPALEGRDTPSLGLRQAAIHIGNVFASAGLVPAADSAERWKAIQAVPAPTIGATTGEGGATFLRPFTRSLPEPDPDGCALSVVGDAKSFVLGTDYAPIAGATGEAKGRIVFAGFGIVSTKEGYDDLKGLDLAGKIALIVEGEPRHTRRFDGTEVTSDASLWEKLEDLAHAKAAGAIVVRRPPQRDAKKDKDLAALPMLGAGFRHTWADWVGSPPDPKPKKTVPAIEVTVTIGNGLLGEDIDELAAKIDKSGKPLRTKGNPVEVSFRARTREAAVATENVVGLVPGTDAALASEYVVVGAHYDHLGVDTRGRIARGADDNASGTAALMEIAQALAVAGPRRSVLLCAFAGEEDGLLGAKAFVATPPVPMDKVVAMINLDMIGRGDASEVAVLGIPQNPALERVLERARGLKTTGVQKVVVRQGEDLFARSDHFAFHQAGVPVLFFFEGLPIDRNRDYHTWRDVPELVDHEKVARTTRLVFNTAWLLANDDERPPRPRE